MNCAQRLTTQEAINLRFEPEFRPQRWTNNAELIKVGVHGDSDPGYGSTSKMISEAAIALLTQKTGCPEGIWTPGASRRTESAPGDEEEAE